MADKQQRSNREKRKPKADKSRPPAQTSPFERAVGMGGVRKGASKKGR
jgi:hypothetical protein